MIAVSLIPRLCGGDLGTSHRGTTDCITYQHTHLQTLSFVKREELVAFAVVVNTYYQLLVDANAIIIEGNLKPPERWFRVGENGGSVSPVCLSVCLSVCQLISLSVCSSISLSVSSVSLSVCLSVCQSVCLSVLFTIGLSILHPLL